MLRARGGGSGEAASPSSPARLEGNADAIRGLRLQLVYGSKQAASSLRDLSSCLQPSDFTSSAAKPNPSINP